MNLSLFCACHITNISDLNYVKEMIQSVKNQKLSTKLWLSVSHEQSQAIKYEEIQNWFKIHLPGGNHLIMAKSPKSQFEHYQLLLTAYMREHAGEDETKHWISSIEDTDTIGEGRMMAIKNLIDQIPPANNFDKFYLSDCVYIWRSSPFGPACPKQFDFTVNVRLFYWFMSRAGPHVRRTKVTSKFFRNFLLNIQDQEIFPSIQPTSMKDICAQYLSDNCQYNHRQYRSNQQLISGTVEQMAWDGLIECLVRTRSKFNDKFFDQFLRKYCPEVLQHVTASQITERFRHERAQEFEAIKNCPYIEEYFQFIQNGK